MAIFITVFVLTKLYFWQQGCVKCEVYLRFGTSTSIAQTSSYLHVGYKNPRRLIQITTICPLLDDMCASQPNVVLLNECWLFFYLDVSVIQCIFLAIHNQFFLILWCCSWNVPRKVRANFMYTDDLFPCVARPAWKLRVLTLSNGKTHIYILKEDPRGSG